MNIDDLTLKQIREIQNLFPTAPMETVMLQEFQELLDKNVIVRTVTMIYTGKLKKVTPDNLVLMEAAWIPETERFMQFVATGAVRECEPYPDDLPVYINRGALLDTCELRKELPRSQK